MAEGHRPAIIRLIAVLAATLFNLPQVALSFTTWVFSLLNLWLAFSLYRGDQPSSTRDQRAPWPLALLCFSAITFIIHDEQGWTDYYFSTWQISTSAYLCAAISLQRLSGWRAILAATFFATLSSLSLGLGIASWIALPIMALGFKKYRKPVYGLFWALASSGFIYIYSSALFDPLLQAEQGSKLAKLAAAFDQGWTQVIVTLLLKVPILSLARAWLPADQALGRDFDLFMILFSAISLLAFFYLISRLISKQAYSSASTWLGLASFSFLGSWLVFISRQKLMPDPRHGAGSVAFWLAFAALLIGCLSSPSFKSESKGLIGLLAKSMLIFMVLASLTRNIIAFTLPARFPKTCESLALNYFKDRTNDLRSCFWYIDERSIYQAALLGMAGLSAGKGNFPEPLEHTFKASVLPGKLLTALVAEDSSNSEGRDHPKGSRFFDVSFSTQDEVLKGMVISPFHRSMDWTGKGRFYKTSDFAFTKQQFMQSLRTASQANRQSIVLYSASETKHLASEIKNELRSEGWIEVDRFRIKNTANPEQFLLLQCFRTQRGLSQPQTQPHPLASSCWRKS